MGAYCACDYPSYGQRCGLTRDCALSKFALRDQYKLEIPVLAVGKKKDDVGVIVSVDLVDRVFPGNRERIKMCRGNLR